MANIREVKISSPDYIGKSSGQAIKDFMARIAHYEKIYDTLTVDEGVPFVKIINTGEQVQLNHIRGYLQSRIVYFLMNLNITPRHIYFSRHGESMFNVVGKIGGDSDLSERGWAFARQLPMLFERELSKNAAGKGVGSVSVPTSPVTESALPPPQPPLPVQLPVQPGQLQQPSVLSSSPAAQHEESTLPVQQQPLPIPPPPTLDSRSASQISYTSATSIGCSPTSSPTATAYPLEPETLTVWTSTLKRTIQTASLLPYPKMQWKQLDEIDAGLSDGMTYEEISRAFPDEYAERDHDKYNFRYRGGESYRDLVQRLEPVIMELERHHERGHSIFIVGHQAVLRCIYAYFLNYSTDELPYLKIPLHTVIKLTPKAYGCMEE
ncbi:Fructose-2,6-bisphosphatase, partial [Quaeritorhiza haematococci]